MRRRRDAGTPQVNRRHAGAERPAAVGTRCGGGPTAGSGLFRRTLRDLPQKIAKLAMLAGREAAERRRWLRGPLDHPGPEFGAFPGHGDHLDPAVVWIGP